MLPMLFEAGEERAMSGLFLAQTALQRCGKEWLKYLCCLSYEQGSDCVRTT